MRSCSSSVLVHESVEQVAPVDLGHRILASEGRFDSRIRRLQPERPVWAMGVVVLDVDPQHLLEVAAADDQQPVQALGPDRPDPAFGVGVGVGRLYRRDQYLGAVRMEDVVEGAGELRIPIAKKAAHSSAPLTQHETQVAGLLGNPGPMRVGRYAGQMDPPGPQLDEEPHVQPPQPGRVDGEEVACHDSGRLLAQECSPGRGRRPWRWIQSMTAEGGADRGCRDLHPEAQQFSLDALVTPPGILLGQADDQLLDVVVQRWSSGLVRVGPGTGDEASVPTQHRLRPDEETRPACLGEDAADGSKQGSVGGLEFGPWCLAAQHSELVAEDEDLQILGGVVMGEQGEELDGAAGCREPKEKVAGRSPPSASNDAAGQLPTASPRRGRWSSNRAPTPPTGSATTRRPPWLWASWRARYRPRPTPPARAVALASSWVNRSKMRCRSAGGIPGPASSTTRTTSPPSRAHDSRTGSLSGEYLQALSSRLPMTCSTASALTRTGRAPLVSTVMRSPWRARASAPARRPRSATSTGARGNGKGITPSPSWKRAANSSCSIIRRSRSLCRSAMVTSSARSPPANPTPPRLRVWSTPLMVVSGVRSSWVTAAIRSAFNRSVSWRLRTSWRSCSARCRSCSACAAAATAICRCWSANASAWARRASASTSLLEARCTATSGNSKAGTSSRACSAITTATGASASSMAEVATSTRRSSTSPPMIGVPAARLTTTPTSTWLTSKKTAPPTANAARSSTPIGGCPPRAKVTAAPAVRAITHWAALKTTLTGALRRTRSATTDPRPRATTPIAGPASSTSANAKVLVAVSSRTVPRWRMGTTNSSPTTTKPANRAKVSSSRGDLCQSAVPARPSSNPTPTVATSQT